MAQTSSAEQFGPRRRGRAEAVVVAEPGVADQLRGGAAAEAADALLATVDDNADPRMVRKRLAAVKAAGVRRPDHGGVLDLSVSVPGTSVNSPVSRQVRSAGDTSRYQWPGASGASAAL